MRGEEYKNYFDKDYFETAGIRSFYSTSNYNRESYINEAIAQWLFQTLLDSGYDIRQAKTLEIGCAYGWVVEEVLKLGVDVYGQDISNYTISSCPKAVKGRVVECQSFEIAFNEKFDFVYSIETFEHIPQESVPVYFNNIYHSMNPYGLIFCTICLGHNNDRGKQDIDISHQTLQPRKWWVHQFENTGFIRRKDLEADCYEIGIQTPKMAKGEWLPRHYNWHMFCFERPESRKSRIMSIKDSEETVVSYYSEQ